MNQMNADIAMTANLAVTRFARATGEAVSDKPTAVIDANAIMSGVPLGSLADRLVTIPEVLEEIRDVKTRERLAALHVVLETLEPTDEAVAAGTAHSAVNCI